jgi:hypothetical protein
MEDEANAQRSTLNVQRSMKRKQGAEGHTSRDRGGAIASTRGACAPQTNRRYDGNPWRAINSICSQKRSNSLSVV